VLVDNHLWRESSLQSERQFCKPGSAPWARCARCRRTAVSWMRFPTTCCPPRPRARPCKLALIDCADRRMPMSYAVFRVCKRARQFCKLGSTPT